MKPTAGICRHCGCTEDRACRLSDGDTCAWVTSSRLVCSNSNCIKAERARIAGLRAKRPKSRFAGMGYGLICETMRREQAAKKKRRAA